MATKAFTEAEASEKVGRTIQTTVPFLGVSTGTTGTVICSASASRAKPLFETTTRNVYAVAVEWDLGDAVIGPSVDWFTRDEYERLLVEIDRKLDASER